MTGAPLKKTRDEAFAYIRDLLSASLPRETFDQLCIQVATISPVARDAELKKFSAEMMQFMKERHSEISEAQQVARPYVFAQMVRQRLAAMPRAGRA
jgi:hypothetical protein